MTKHAPTRPAKRTKAATAAGADYQQFLTGKIRLAEDFGFAADADQLHPSTLPHQADTILWALKKGRALIGSSFGLGKTHTQIEVLRLCQQHAGGLVLIVCPLGVKHQFTEEDGPRLGVDIRYVRNDAEAAEAGTPFLITNYERVRDGHFSPAFLASLTAVSLDEGSVLRSVGSETHQQFTKLLAPVPFRYVCTATPSPNRYTELNHYAAFLGVMDSGQALTRWFKRDSQKAGNLTLHPQHEADYWLWVSSWALFLTTPSDLGYSDAGYDLPALQVHWHLVAEGEADLRTDSRGQVEAFASTGGNLPAAAREKKRSIGARVAKMLEIANSFTYIRGQLSTDGNATGTQQGLLRGQQGEGEGAEAGPLPRQQGSIGQGETEGVLCGVQQDAPAKKANTGRAGRTKREASGAVCSRPITPGESEAAGAGLAGKKPGEENQPAVEGSFRDNAGALQSATGCPGREVCDMRDGRAHQGPDATVCGPLPQHAEDSGAAVLPLQLRAGALSGQSGAAAEGSGLPDQFIVFCHLNDEQTTADKALLAAGYSVASIFGGLSDDEKERRLYTWKSKEKTVFLTKPEMYGAGVNLQQACKTIFLGIDYRFEDFIQAVHRTHRFQQAHPVQVHILYTPAEEPIRKELEAKWARHTELMATMRGIIRQHGLSHEVAKAKLTRSMGVQREEAQGQRYTAVHNDCVAELPRLADNSVGLIHTSIPFGNHYEYSANYADFGHNDDNDAFFGQLDYLIPELHRVLKPGRIAAIHVKDRVRYGSVTGDSFIALDPFSDQTSAAFRKHGFRLLGRITVLTDVVRENNQTYRLGYTEMCKDGSKMGVGLPEYILLLRKMPSSQQNGYADEPVVKDKADYLLARWQVDAGALYRSSGDRLLTPVELQSRSMDRIGQWWKKRNLFTPYDYQEHVAIGEVLQNAGRLPSSFSMVAPQSAHPDVWTDISYMRSLNGEQSKRNVENHICPLPFDIVDRIIERYSNEDDLVLDPFLGIGTVVFRAVQLGRKGYGIELKKEYWKAAVQYCKEAEYKQTVPTLFDFLDSKPVTV